MVPVCDHTYLCIVHLPISVFVYLCSCPFWISVFVCLCIPPPSRRQWCWSVTIWSVGYPTPSRTRTLHHPEQYTPYTHTHTHIHTVHTHSTHSTHTHTNRPRHAPYTILHRTHRVRKYKCIHKYICANTFQQAHLTPSCTVHTV